MPDIAFSILAPIGALRRLMGPAAAALLLVASMPPAAAIEQGTPAGAAILIDTTSGAILLEKEADAPIPPASMSKLMTLEVVFEAIASGQLSLDSTFRTSQRASQMGGSRMFLRQGELVSVEDLLRGVIVQSGNDAALALAEALSGTEERFADVMNRRAEAIGMTGSHFVNATGWPHPEHVMTARDLAILAEDIITRFPELYAYFSEESFTWEDITQRNRNPLLGLDLGVDGLKTGHTEEAGYGLVSSAEREGRRVVLVLTGLESSAQRKQEAERLINWAFRAFETRRLFSAGAALAEVPVWIGASSEVLVAPARDVIVTMPFGVPQKPALELRYRSPAPAPIAAGDRLGDLVLTVEGMPEVTVPLVAADDVARGGFLSRLRAAAELVLRRVMPEGAG